MEYTFTIATTIEADDEDQAEAILRDQIMIPDEFIVALVEKYDPDTDRCWRYNDYYGWEEC